MTVEKRFGPHRSILCPDYSALAKTRLPHYLSAMSATHTQTDSLPAETPEERQARLAWEAQAIEEALQSAERDGTIPLEEVEAWVESWDTPNELPPPEPRK